MNIFKIFLVASLFFGCANKVTIKSVEISQSALIFFKLGKLKYFDSGFIKNHNNGLLLEIYTAGVPTLRIITDSENICLNQECYTKEVFVKLHFGKDYYKDILDDIFSGQPIFGGVNLVFNNSKKYQKIELVDDIIEYTLENGNIEFIAKNILIRIKKND
jgi:hypothetical protein